MTTLTRWNRALLARLSRVTTGGALIPEIDGLRFIAIASVVLFHLNISLREKSGFHFDLTPADEAFKRLMSAGNFGVPVFFAISGFILALPFAKAHFRGEPNVPLKPYFWRRVTRLEPPYIINLLICYILLITVWGKDPVTLLKHLGASFVYLHNLIFAKYSVINYVAWSLEIEIQFYVLMPLLANVYSIRNTVIRRTVIAATALTTGLLAEFVFPGFYRAPLQLFAWLHYFLVGFLLVDLYLVDWKSKPSATRLWDIIGLGSWLMLALLLYLRIYRNLVTPPFLLLGFIGAFRGPALKQLVTLPWVAVSGGMCYSVYLYHDIVTELMAPLTHKIYVGPSYLANFAVQALLIVPPVFVVSALFFVFLEKPFMYRDWPERLRARLAGKPQAT